jgi:hypothetical protein
MKPPSDGRVGWRFYRIPRLAKLGLTWSLRLYSELHETTTVFYMNLYHEITTRCSRVVVWLARIVLTLSIPLYSELHYEITTRCSIIVALLQGTAGQNSPQLELASLLGAS